MNIQVTALLPMKGHSERIANKNMRIFAGKPLYHCVARILQESNYISTIVVDTDSQIIAENAKETFSKVKIVDRPKEICGDMVSMNTIIEYDLSVVEGKHFLQTHSTNPLLTQETLEKAINIYFSRLKEYDSLFSVTKLQTRLYWKSGEPVNHNPLELLRTQDLPPLFEENSNIYCFSKQSFFNAHRQRIGLQPQMFVMEPLESIDIDEETDFQIAELLYLRRKNQTK